MQQAGRGGDDALDLVGIGLLIVDGARSSRSRIARLWSKNFAQRDRALARFVFLP